MSIRSEAAAATATAPTRTCLADIARGGCVEVVGTAENADPQVARRLFDLGFRPGAHVEVMRRAPLRDPVIFRVADAELALRRAEAALLLVRPA